MSGGNSSVASFRPKAIVSSSEWEWEWVMVSVVIPEVKYSEGAAGCELRANRLLVAYLVSSGMNPAADSESGRRLQLLGGGVQETAVERRIERHAQLAVVIVSQGNKAERLQTRALKLARRAQHFSHAADGAGAGVEGDFDEISGGKLTRQLQ